MSFWTDTVAVVTGGGAGIGRATAHLFGQLGARVVVTDVDADGGQETVRQMAHPDRALFLLADSRSEDDAAHVVDAAVSTFGSLDVLHNNAGVLQRYDRIEDVPTEEFRRVLDINLVGIFIMAKAAIPVMRAQGRGVIVNMASSGARGVPASLAYASSKAGVIALTRGLAPQVAADGVRVNALMPGLVETQMTIGGVHLAAAKAGGGAYFGPEDMAVAAAYLAEHEELNGAVLEYAPSVDGPRFTMITDYTGEPLPPPVAPSRP